MTTANVNTYPWVADENGRIDQKEAEKALDEARRVAHRWELRFRALKTIAMEEMEAEFLAGAEEMREAAARYVEDAADGVPLQMLADDGIRALPTPQYRIETLPDSEKDVVEPVSPLSVVAAKLESHANGHKEGWEAGFAAGCKEAERERDEARAEVLRLRGMMAELRATGAAYQHLLLRERDEAREQAKANAEFSAAETEHANRWSERAIKAERELKHMKERPVEVENARLDTMWQQLVRERDEAVQALQKLKSTLSEGRWCVRCQNIEGGCAYCA